MTKEYKKIFDLANRAIEDIDNHYFANSPGFSLAMRVKSKLEQITDITNPYAENLKKAGLIPTKLSPMRGDASND